MEVTDGRNLVEIAPCIVAAVDRREESLLRRVVAPDGRRGLVGLVNVERQMIR